MKIAILGFASQGQSSYNYWNTDNEITICDRDESIKVPAGSSSQLGKDYLKDLDRFERVIRTPFLHPRDILAANPESPQILDKVWSNTNEFLKVCPTKNIIGVTGTKGKGTTSTLITKMLEAAGEKVHLGGNIGTPPLDLLVASSYSQTNSETDKMAGTYGAGVMATANQPGIQPTDWVVLELANFQLIDLKLSPHIGVCLMVEPEHLDWHEDYDEYVNAKQQLFINQTTDDLAIYYAYNEDSLSVADASEGRLVPYLKAPGAVIENDIVCIGGKEICKTSDLKLLGKHNWQNVCAAVTAVWQITQNIEAIASALTTFSGLEHRLELIRELDGVKYYDDSFGTTPSTAQVAIEAFSEPKVIILGGSNKGATYEHLAKTVANSNVRAVICVGVTGPAIAEALKHASYTNIFEAGNTMPEIVATAKAQAKSGDIVLLSTGCASFDLFKNYKDRGEQFKSAVLTLS